MANPPIHPSPRQSSTPTSLAAVYSGLDRINTITSRFATRVTNVVRLRRRSFVGASTCVEVLAKCLFSCSPQQVLTAVGRSAWLPSPMLAVPATVGPAQREPFLVHFVALQSRRQHASCRTPPWAGRQAGRQAGLRRTYIHKAYGLTKNPPPVRRKSEYSAFENNTLRCHGWW